jgi:hypothetical protein
MQWNTGPNAGFSTATPWRAVGSNFMSNNVATMSEQPSSLLNHYKRLVHLRNQHDALRRGVYLPAQNSAVACLSYARRYGQDVKVVVHNLGLNSAQPSISLAASTLTPGTYYVNDLYSETNLGTINIDENGGFADWQPDVALSGNATWILDFSDQPLSATSVHPNKMEPLLYPNPTQDHVFLHGIPFQNYPLTIEIADIQGRVVLRKQITSDNGIDVSTLDHGVYWMRIPALDFHKALPFVKIDK